MNPPKLLLKRLGLALATSAGITSFGFVCSLANNPISILGWIVFFPGFLIAALMTGNPHSPSTVLVTVVSIVLWSLVAYGVRAFIDRPKPIAPVRYWNPERKAWEEEIQTPAKCFKTDEKVDGEKPQIKLHH